MCEIGWLKFGKLDFDSHYGHEFPIYNYVYMSNKICPLNARAESNVHHSTYTPGNRVMRLAAFSLSFSSTFVKWGYFVK